MAESIHTGMLQRMVSVRPVTINYPRLNVLNVNVSGEQLSKNPLCVIRAKQKLENVSIAAVVPTLEQESSMEIQYVRSVLIGFLLKDHVKSVQRNSLDLPTGQKVGLYAHHAGSE